MRKATNAQNEKYTWEHESGKTQSMKWKLYSKTGMNVWTWKQVIRLYTVEGAKRKKRLKMSFK